MNSISLAGTDNTPEVKCNFENETLSFYGRSIPENANEFYSPILNWLKDYISSPKENLHITFELDYINSISYKMIFEILMIAEQINNSGKKVDVLWKYEEDDDEILDEGKHFASKLQLDFTFEEVPEED